MSFARIFHLGKVILRYQASSLRWCSGAFKEKQCLIKKENRGIRLLLALFTATLSLQEKCILMRKRHFLSIKGESLNIFSISIIKPM